jgi:hypothetical protein
LQDFVWTNNNIVRPKLQAGRQTDRQTDRQTNVVIIFTRWQDFVWTNNNIVRPLLHVMMDKFNNEPVLCWVIDAIAHVSR